MPHTATVWMLPARPEPPVSRASAPRLKKMNMSITTPSKMRSMTMVARLALTGTPSSRRST